ncbi:DNA replication complex GINS protein [Yarrowia sp. B02]|nr:DNA replication complex GINS protein [Yarrowia sp. B02]
MEDLEQDGLDIPSGLDSSFHGGPPTDPPNNFEDDDIDDLINNVRQHDPMGTLEEKEADIRGLTKAWVTERMSPTLLPTKETLLFRILRRVQMQIEVIEEKSIDMSPDTDVKLELLIVETELERIKYLIRSYLRVRLLKIDNAMEYYQSSPLDRMNMSQTERMYLTRHYALLKNLYAHQFMNTFPESLKQMNDSSGSVSMVQEPNMDHPVFVRVVKDTGRKIIIGNDSVKLRKGSIVVIKYSIILKYVESGDVEFI